MPWFDQSNRGRKYCSDVFSSRVQINAGKKKTQHQHDNLSTATNCRASYGLTFLHVSSLLIHMIGGVSVCAALVLITLINFDIYNSPLCNMQEKKKKTVACRRNNPSLSRCTRGPHGKTLESRFTCTLSCYFTTPQWINSVQTPGQ